MPLLKASDSPNRVITVTSIEADYTNVHFSLDSKLLENQNVFVYGNFNNFELNESNLMAYDPIKKRYQCNIKFKQGFYNYKYVVVRSKRERTHRNSDINFVSLKMLDQN